MIDFSEKPITKSKEETEFDDLCEKYYEVFGENFGYSIGGHIPETLQVAIDEVKKCIETGEKQKVTILKGSNGY